MQCGRALIIQSFWEEILNDVYCTCLADAQLIQYILKVQYGDIIYSYFPYWLS